jgi:hydrogenase maturation factor
LRAKDQVLLAHASGGKLTAELIRDIFLQSFQNPILARLADQAVVTVNGLRLAFNQDALPRTLEDGSPKTGVCCYLNRYIIFPQF